MSAIYLPSVQASEESQCLMEVDENDKAAGATFVMAKEECADYPTDAPEGCKSNICLYCRLPEYDDSSLSFVPECPSEASANTTTSSSGKQESVTVVGSSECGVSYSDMLAGIQVISDDSCSDGGLGCYNFSCRHCKVEDSEKSAHLTSCSELGYEFTMPPRVVLTDPCTVSEGDAAVGIGAITDAECFVGGLGCFNDHCRFCKTAETAESKGYPDCPSSSAVCTTVPTAQNIADGISITTDTSCAEIAGKGCLDDLCRECKVLTTIKSWSLLDCAMLAN